MNLYIPDTLTAGNSEKYTVSIRLWPGGLSFAGWISSEKDSFFYVKTETDRKKRYDFLIKDLFFAHPFFSYVYKQIYVVSVNRQYTLVPATIFEEKQKEQLMSFVFSAPDEKVLHEPLEEFESILLYSIQPQVYEFLARSLLRPTFTHAITPALNQWKKHNLTGFPKQLYVAFHEDMIDIACFDKGALMFINSFHVEDAADIVYYILYIWKLTGLDQLKDELFLYTNPQKYPTLKETLQTYLSHIEFFQPQCPDTGMEVPPDITALFQCGL